MKLYKDYEPVIGLEIHVELATEAKLFCACPTVFGAEPNTQCCPVCLGHPGTLPKLNKTAAEYAVMAGIATGCSISRYSRFDRKNYFYPDLPKAYQITQAEYPFCLNGFVDIDCDGASKRIGITRIHLEEDAGKLIHHPEKGTLIDCNRCGIPLIEIVSEPDIRSSEEAVAYTRKLRSIITSIGISDCKMNEGSLRCDVNISVRKLGCQALGTRTEIKNINSFAFIQKAIEYEYLRQAQAIENGELILQETRRFDEKTGKTYSMRSKENSSDYRFFPEPDIPPVFLDEAWIASLSKRLPELPDARKKRYINEMGLPEYTASLLVADRLICDYFEKAASLSRSPQDVATLIISELFRLLPDSFTCIPLPDTAIAEIADMLSLGEINFAVAKRALKHSYENGGSPRDFVCENSLFTLKDINMISQTVSEVIKENPKPVCDYLAGKTAAFKSLVGLCMKKTDGRAEPQILNDVLLDLLNNP